MQANVLEIYLHHQTVHHPLEGGGCVHQADVHDYRLKGFLTADKDRMLRTGFAEPNFAVAEKKVQRSENPISSKFVKNFFSYQ